MKLRFMRFEHDLKLETNRVSTLEIRDRALFAQAVFSLVSHDDKGAVEPYAFYSEDGKEIASRKCSMVLNSLPVVPINDKALLSALFAKVANELSNNPDSEDRFLSLMTELGSLISAFSLESWGSYEFRSTWEIEPFLKAFDFGTIELAKKSSLLERCIALFELCADVSFDKLIVLVNAKTFFSKEEVETLFSQAVFCGVRLLLLESLPDDGSYDLESKLIIDQDFCEWRQ